MDNHQTRSRRHHYLFAHRALPSLFYSNPSETMEHLRRDKTRYLRFWWEQVGEQSLEDKSERMPANALGCRIEELADNTVVALVILPMPMSVTEAYFTALVYRPAKKKLFARGEALTRYISLEYGASYDGSLRTVFCEWTADGAHLNRGDGPEPTLKAFFEAVCKLISPDHP